VVIEFANELALDLDGNRFYAFGMITPNTVYTGPFLSLDWRGSKCFGQLDEIQLDAGIELTLDICRRHDIEPVFYYPLHRIDYPAASRWQRSSAHSNCRAEKADLCFAGMGVRKIWTAGIRLQTWLR
jgi:hypothetical protein